MGAVITDRLVHAGLEVIAVARTGDLLQELERRHSKVRTCIADIAEDSAIERISATINKPVRMVVHAAGLAPTAMGSVLEVSTASVAHSFAVKPAGMIRLVRAVDAHLVAGSRLVAVAGHLGLEPTSNSANAGMANAALINLMRQYSLLYGKRGITAHVIAPGPTETDRLARGVATRAVSRGLPEESIRNQIRAESPINRIATCEQVAWAVTLLLAAEAEVITGSTLTLDYGRRHGLP
jgi:NAD(P)-dependent dehydrogenase (short-subunit alcohol dehydrogenase family)